MLRSAEESRVGGAGEGSKGYFAHRSDGILRGRCVGTGQEPDRTHTVHACLPMMHNWDTHALVHAYSHVSKGCSPEPLQSACDLLFRVRGARPVAKPRTAADAPQPPTHVDQYSQSHNKHIFIDVQFQNSNSRNTASQGSFWICSYCTWLSPSRTWAGTRQPGWWLGRVPPPTHQTLSVPSSQALCARGCFSPAQGRT